MTNQDQILTAQDISQMLDDVEFQLRNIADYTDDNKVRSVIKWASEHVGIASHFVYAQGESKSVARTP